MTEIKREMGQRKWKSFDMLDGSLTGVIDVAYDKNKEGEGSSSSKKI